MKPVSMDLRQRIVDAYKNGEGSIRKLAQRFQVSVDLIRRLLKQEREARTLEPKPHSGGSSPKIMPEHLEVLRELVDEDNDATLRQLAERLEAQTGLKLALSSVWRALDSLGFTRKKKSFKASEVQTPAKQQKRAEFRQQVNEFDPKNFIFIDESGFNRGMTPEYARSPEGERAYSERPTSKGKNLSVIGAISLNQGVMTGLSFEGGMTGRVFLFFIEELLVPILWPGAIVILDNLPAHKVDGVLEAIEAAGANVLYLSPYSPDFNPIENLWSKVKAFVRRAEARTKEALDEAISNALETITLKDIQNWFIHCCYGTQLS